MNRLSTNGFQAFIAVLLALLVCGRVESASGQELTDRDKSRLARLDKMAASLEEVHVKKQNDSPARVVEGRRQSDVSELNFRFLSCASGLINDDKDGMLLFPLQVSGFSSSIKPGSKPRRKTGSDFVEVRVVFAGLIGAETPEVDIKLPAFKQGSTFPAADLVREEIQRRIERFFPEAEIKGRQSRKEKRLRIKNTTDEALQVWVHRRTLDFNETDGYQWRWVPADPGSRAEVLVVPAGESKYVEHSREEGPSKPATAQRVRLWAESESGQQWSDYRDKDLWLVEKNTAFDNRRIYISEELATYEHVFEPKPGPHVFTERVLRMKNLAPEPLSLKLEYRATSAGRAGWRKVELTIPAGGSVEPKDEADMRIRAARIRFSAESENRKYETHQSEDLWLVERAAGGRAYQADKIGQFEYIFLPAAKGVVQATIVADNTPVMSGTTALARVSRGNKFDVLEQREGWARIAVDSGGQRHVGWVQEKYVEVNRPTAASPPSQGRSRFRVTSNSADMKIGTEAIARIPAGREFDVLEERDGWVRLELEVSGETLHGWVSKSHGRVQ